MWSVLISKIANETLDLLYPPGIYCKCCGKITDRSRTYGLCNDCMAAMSWVSGRTCRRCGKTLGHNDTGEVCYYCRHHEHDFDRGYACCEYDAHAKMLLYELKYASRGAIGKTIGEIAYDRMAAELGETSLKAAYDSVLPVPIHIGRKEQRGFNQAELMAEEFSKRAGIPCDSGLLIRTRETKAMKGLGPAERRANIQGAFEVRARKRSLVNGRRFLLMDDIFTTGATLDEASRVLKDAGAASVEFVVFAAGADLIS